MQRFSFLYPDFMRRLDHHLLTHHPNIWRTRIHEFGWFSFILGNLLAIIAGFVVANIGYAVTEREMNLLYLVALLLPGFVLLFWMMNLRQYPPSFSNYKSVLLTWLIYAGCMASLSLNLTTFTASIAYSTASLDDYPLSLTSTDLELFKTAGSKNIGNHEHVIQRYSHIYNIKTPLLSKDVSVLRNHLSAVKAAKMFIAQPVLGKDFQEIKKRTFYHHTIIANWLFTLFILCFLPAVLFVADAFGWYTALVSVFISAILGVCTLTLTAYMTKLEDFFYLVLSAIVLTFVSFLLTKIGSARFWKYTAGAFLLLVPFTFIAIFFAQKHQAPSPPLLELAATFLLLSPVAALCIYEVIKKRQIPTAV